MELVLMWIGFSVIAGVIAANKGRSGFGFFLISIVLSPVLGILGALVAKPDRSSQEREMIKLGKMKRCPFCAELVKNAAVVCKHCGKSID